MSVVDISTSLEFSTSNSRFALSNTATGTGKAITKLGFISNLLLISRIGTDRFAKITYNKFMEETLIVGESQMPKDTKKKLQSSPDTRLDWSRS
jgi:hypothetical protein